MEKEIVRLRNQVTRLKMCFLITLATFISVTVSFQIQYSRILSYYQETAEMNQQILLNQKWQNSELQRSLSMIEKLVAGHK